MSMSMSRRLEVAALAFLLAVAAALAAALLLLVCRQNHRRRRGSSGSGTTTKRRPTPELPLSTATKDDKGHRCHLALLLTLLSGSRARVEPRPSSQTTDPPPVAADHGDASSAEEEWRERWFAHTPASRALYTIYEQYDEEAADSDDEQAVETPPFYTPPASPPRVTVEMTP